MSPEEDLAPELKSLEAALAGLVPRADGLQRDRLFYLAGQESVRHVRAGAASRVRRMAWPAASAAMTVVAAALAVLLVVRPQPQPIKRVVYVPVATADQRPARDRQPEKGRSLPAPETDTPNTPPPESPGLFGTSLAAASPGDGWWVLRRRGLDLAALDRALAVRKTARGPGAATAVERQTDASPASYRRLLAQLLRE